MKKKIIILVLSLLFVFTLFSEGKIKLSSRQRNKLYKKLTKKYKYWYEMVYHISTKEEKNVFLLLKNDRERDMFIDAFWKQRDPTPGTPENEYKTEIETRFVYVNKRFGLGASRPGWRTDMGRIYMILGKPNSINRYDNRAGLYPAQVWWYYGDKRLGLPTYFNVTFFKPNNTTVWKLYRPAVDGPQALLVQQQPIDTENYAAIYNKIKEYAPGLEQPAISMVPNESYREMQPSLRNNIILSNIIESPKRKINASYATNFLKYKGFVDAETSTNYISNKHMITLTKYPMYDFNFINVSIKPSKISVGYHKEKDKYFFNFELTVNLKKNNKFIYQYTKNFDFYIEPSKVNALRGRGIVIHDSFPVIPGNYDLMVFIKNTVGKEFTYFDKKISVPKTKKVAFLSTPLIGYKTIPQSDQNFLPYKFLNKKLSLDAEYTFKLNQTPYFMIGCYNVSQSLWEKGYVLLEINGLNERYNFKKKIKIMLKDYKKHKNMNIIYIPKDLKLRPDYYEVKTVLYNEINIPLDTKEVRFTVSPLNNISYPIEVFKRAKTPNPYMFYYIIANQYENLNQLKQAEDNYFNSYKMNPDFTTSLVKYLEVLNKEKEYNKVLVEVKKLKGIEKYKFDFYLIKGTALFGNKDYDNAIDVLLKANEIYDSDIRVLNMLGVSLYKVNNLQEAIKPLKSSLRLNSNQPIIKNLVKEIENNLKK